MLKGDELAPPTPQHTILPLQQLTTCGVVKEIYGLIGKRLQTDDEEEPPFDYIGLHENFNGVDMHQYKDCIHISCPEYIKQIVTSHEWNDQPEFKSEST